MNLEITAKTVNEEGIIKIKKFFNEEELKTALKIVEYYNKPKTHPDTFFSINNKELIGKLIQLKISKFIQSLILLNIGKKKKLNKIANKILNQKSYLRTIDGYCSRISDKEVLPWHCDQAYSGNPDPKKFVNPEHYNIKFFVYLTKIYKNNGCTSYIPRSHLIAYAIREGIYKNIINYSPYWSLTDFRNYIKKEKIYIYLKNYFGNDQLIKKFLEETDFIEKNIDSDKFDFSLEAGDAIIFNDGGFHKGSKILYSDRKVIRYLYSIKK
jgi:hypothetical protein